jgi:nicotinamidase/pyrazinamidase
LCRSGIIINKGTNKDAECYSGFEDVYGKSTGLANTLREKVITRIDVCGLALDYCVNSTAFDGLKEGFAVNLLFDLTKGVDRASSFDAVEKLLNAGVTFILSKSVQ